MTQAFLIFLSLITATGAHWTHKEAVGGAVERSEGGSLLFWPSLHVWDCETTAWCTCPFPGTPESPTKSISFADSYFQSGSTSRGLGLHAFLPLHWLSPLPLSSALLTNSHSSLLCLQGQAAEVQTVPTICPDTYLCCKECFLVSSVFLQRVKAIHTSNY